jgi:hypothetical protein
MKNSRRLSLWFLFTLSMMVVGTRAAAAAECDNFLPKKGCQVTVDFKSGVQSDIAVLPGDRITVVVNNRPPFATCSIAASPSALTRDLSTSIGTFLTTLGSLGAIGSNPQTPRAFPPPGTPAHPAPPNAAAESLEQQYLALKNQETATLAYLQQVSREYKAVQDDVKTLWAPKENPETYIAGHIEAVKTELKTKIEGPEPSIESLKIALSSLNDSMKAFRQRYSGDQTVKPWLDDFSPKLDDVNGVGDTYLDYLSDLIHARAAFKQASQELQGAKSPYTSQTLPLSGFSNKQVAITLSCKDDITSAPSADNIIFTAYYVKLPILDLSAGVIFSLLGRHQIGVVGQTSAQASSMTNTNGTFAVTDSSSFQVIAMALVELHTRGTKCGKYICTVGGVIGLGPNNATGTTVAEFFEGGSFAIQRVSLLVGFHDGRYEHLGGGYNIGDTPPTAGYTPIINRVWNVRPAFGITYRIPLH